MTCVRLRGLRGYQENYGGGQWWRGREENMENSGGGSWSRREKTLVEGLVVEVEERKNIGGRVEMIVLFN